MSDELNIALQETGLTDLVARIYDAGLTAQVGSDVTMTETGMDTGRYSGSVPVSVLGTKQYLVLFYRTTPDPDLLLGTGSLVWNASGDKEGVPGELTQESWKDRGLDIDDNKTITEISVGLSYDEDNDGITKEVRKAGIATTVTRVP